MGVTWILVANASSALLYANHGPRKGLRKIKEFEHPASREKGLSLVTDRPGHNQSAGAGHGAYVSATAPKQNEAHHFALELARELEHGRTSNHYQRLILVSTPHFMGLLNGSLNNHVRNLVSDSLEKDYTKAGEKELSGHLESCIYL